MKENVQELATGLGTVDVNAITPKILATAIEEIRRNEKVWGQFYKTNRDLLTNGGTEVAFPTKNSGISVSWGIGPGTGPTQSSLPYDAVTITFKKGGIGVGIQGEAIRQANRDVLADQISEAGLVWKDTLDIVAMEAMFPSTTFIVTANSLCANDGTIILGVKGTVGDWSAGTLVQTANGSTLYASAATATISCWYVKSGQNKGAQRCAATGVTSGNPGSLTAKDILLARSDMAAYKFAPDCIVVHPDLFAYIIYDPTVKFVESHQVRETDVVWNGEVGQIWGLRVISNISMPKWGVALVDSKHLGYEVVRKELDLKKDEYTGASIDTLYFWGFGERNFGVVNKRAYGVVHVHGTISVAGGFAVQTVS